MKVFRTITLPGDSPRSFIDGFKKDFNEGNNLINADVISPSVGYFYLTDTNFIKCNSFPNDDMMYKYFYPSLADAIYWSGYLYYFNKVLILEIELPQEKIISYTGLGYYSKRKTVELRIPYGYLHDIVNERNSLFNEALAFFNKYNNIADMNKTPFYQTLMKKLQSLITIDNLCMEEVDPLYKYLCFKINRWHKIHILDNRQGLCLATNQVILNRDCWYYSFMDKLDKMPMKDNFKVVEDRVFPFIEEENEILKRTLQKRNLWGNKKC